MADIKFSEFPKATISKDSDEIAVLQDGVNKMISSPLLESKMITKTVEKLTEQGGISLNIVNILGTVPSYSYLESIVNPQINDAYQTKDTGLAYVFTNNGWTSEDEGIKIQPDAVGIVEDGNVNAVSGGEVYNFSKGLVSIDELYNFSETNKLIDGITNFSVGVTLMNNTPALESGFIKSIKLNSLSTGIAKFQVVERLTFNGGNSGNGGGSTDYFKGTSRIIDVVVDEIGVKTYNIDDLLITKGEYLAWIGGVEDVNPVYTETSSVDNKGWWQGTSNIVGSNDIMTFQPLGVLFSYGVYYDKYMRNESDIVVNKLTLTRNSENYNSLRNLVRSITDATEFNQYEIFVPNGEWFEVDLQGNKWVKVIGQDINKTILHCDGNATDPKYVLPADYAYPAEAGKQISTVNQNYLHTIFANNDSYYEDLTIKATRAKYPCHLDSNKYKNARFVNVKFEDINCNYTIGIGVWAGQSLEFYGCVSKRQAGHDFKMGVLIHNWNNQISGSRVHFENTEFINSGYALLDELGSDHLDEIGFINCTNHSYKAFRLMVEGSWVNPDTGVVETDLSKIPYNLFLNASGTEVENIEIETNRDLVKFLNTSITDYSGIAYSEFATVIQKGDILSRTSNGFGFTWATMCVKKFNNDANDYEIVGVALENNQIDELNPVPNTSFKYAPIGKIAKTKVNGTTHLTNGTNKLKWDSGSLVGDSSLNIKEIFGFSTNSKDTTGIGLVDVKLNK